MPKDFLSVDPAAATYKQIRERLAKLRSSSKTPRWVLPFYNDLAVAYNETRTEGILEITRPMQIGNLHRVLRNRGLIRGEDYVAYKRAKEEAGALLLEDQRTILLMKLTEVKMRVL